MRRLLRKIQRRRAATKEAIRRLDMGAKGKIGSVGYPTLTQLLAKAIKGSTAKGRGTIYIRANAAIDIETVLKSSKLPLISVGSAVRTLIKLTRDPISTVRAIAEKNAKKILRCSKSPLNTQLKLKPYRNLLEKALGEPVENPLDLRKRGLFYPEDY